LDNAGITIIPEPFSDNWFLAKKKAGSAKRVTEDLSAAKRIQDSETERVPPPPLHPLFLFCFGLEK
jgi:hypothetical protein